MLCGMWVLIDGGYGQNTTFLKKLEERELKYLGKIAKNRKVIVNLKSLDERKIRIDELAKSLPSQKFEPVIVKLIKTKKSLGNDIYSINSCKLCLTSC
jgi:SRSO17 transposase